MRWFEPGFGTRTCSRSEPGSVVVPPIATAPALSTPAITGIASARFTVLRHDRAEGRSVGDRDRARRADAREPQIAAQLVTQEPRARRVVALLAALRVLAHHRLGDLGRHDDADAADQHGDHHLDEREAPCAEPGPLHWYSPLAVASPRGLHTLVTGKTWIQYPFSRATASIAASFLISRTRTWNEIEGRRVDADGVRAGAHVHADGRHHTPAPSRRAARSSSPRSRACRCTRCPARRAAG
jgi:hypothetical protein